MKPIAARGSLIVSFLAVLLASCSGSAPDLAPKTREVVGADRMAFDATGVGWVTAFKAEAADAGAADWQADLRLANDTRLLTVTRETPEIRFPAGFGLPLAQILRDIPEESWRRTSVVSSGGVKVKATVEFLPAAASGSEPSVRRLYVLSLPVSDEADGDWQVPPGSKTTSKKYSYVVPVDSTVHYGVARLREFAKHLRLTDTTDGKLLWEVAPVPASGIPVYASDTGFPLYRDHEYEIEVLYDNPGPAPIAATAVLYLYYRPPGTEEFSYPVPPPDEATAP